MKLSEIAADLAKLNEPEQSDEAEKAEVEKLILEHPEVSDAEILGTIHPQYMQPHIIHLDHSTGKYVYPDGKPVRRGNDHDQPNVIPENTPDPDEVWLHQVLERRRALMAEQQLRR